MFEEIRDFAIDDVKAALDTDDKTVRDERLKPVYEKVHEHFDEIYPDQAAKIDECMYLTQKFVVRRWLLDEQKRVDGRGMDEIRPLAAEVGLLPRVHGSGMFTRGQTQVLTVATLGSTRDNQLLDGIDDEESKRYIHHYNFPSYSVGETKPPEARADVKSVTALWQSVHLCRLSRRLRSSRIPSVWFPRCFPLTVPRLRAPSAALRWR